MPLEDEFGDVIRKARTGLGLEIADLATRVGLSERDIKGIEVYTRRPSLTEINALAHALGLRASALTALAEETITVPDGPWQVGALHVHRATTHYPSHCYVIGMNRGPVAVIDPGDDDVLEEVVAYATSNGRHAVAILITHGHHDHTGGALRMQERLQVPVYVHEDDASGLASMDVSVQKTYAGPSNHWEHDGLSWTALHTPGHTAGSTTFLFRDSGHGGAFSGDCMFAGSAGGARAGYDRHLRSLRQVIGTLAPETLLYPGHGPASSVGAERQHNPFLED